jgi:hypothetical protein
MSRYLWTLVLVPLLIAFILSALPLQGLTGQEDKIETQHREIFQKKGGYAGPQDCYECHQKQYQEVSRSYHVHQGRITKDGRIAFDPKEAADTGMYVRWYPFSNLSREQETRKQWIQMEVAFCGQCHPGGGPLKAYGMDVDCLICHQKSGYRGGAGLGITPAGRDRTGRVVQSDGGRRVAIMSAGAEAAKDPSRIDLSKIALLSMEGVELRVGKPGPDNCDFCHWRDFGKRGTRFAPVKGEIQDVHYQAGLKCQDCHITRQHEMGKGFVVDTIGTPQLRNTMKKCPDCHTALPHKKGDFPNELNDHLKRIACETCHITKTQTAQGEVNWLKGMDMEALFNSYRWMLPIARFLGMATPERMSGDMQKLIGSYFKNWPAGFIPEYRWNKPNAQWQGIPRPFGSKSDSESKITPFNIILCRFHDQGRDPQVLSDPNGHFNGQVVPKADVARAGGKGKRDTSLGELRSYGDGKYPKAIERHVPLYFQLLHSIAPAKAALTCRACHTPKGGRLDYARLGYSPGEITGLTEER